MPPAIFSFSTEGLGIEVEFSLAVFISENKDLSKLRLSQLGQEEIFSYPPQKLRQSLHILPITILPK